LVTLLNKLERDDTERLLGCSVHLSVVVVRSTVMTDCFSNQGELSMLQLPAYDLGNFYMWTSIHGTTHPQTHPHSTTLA